MKQLAMLLVICLVATALPVFAVAEDGVALHGGEDLEIAVECDGEIDPDAFELDPEADVLAGELSLSDLLEDDEAFSNFNYGIASAIVALVMFLKLSDAFRVCRSPFDEAVIRRMNIFAWTLIVCAVVGSFAGSAAQSAVMAFQNAGIHVGAKNFGVSLDLYPIFAALIVFFLCMIFRYGAQLQQEADETL